MSTHTHGKDGATIKPKAPKVQELIDECQSLMIATLDEDGSPCVSYAPFVQLEGGFQIFVSFMARHTRNLKNQKKTSFMFIEDESTSKQIYARHRLTMDTDAEQVEKENPLWDKAMTALKEKHGKVVEVLEGMDDFIMFNLKPIKGSYVNGFGSAYFVAPDLSIETHRQGAHGTREEKDQ